MQKPEIRKLNINEEQLEDFILESHKEIALKFSIFCDDFLRFAVTDGNSLELIKLEEFDPEKHFELTFFGIDYMIAYLEDLKKSESAFEFSQRQIIRIKKEIKRIYTDKNIVLVGKEENE